MPYLGRTIKASEVALFLWKGLSGEDIDIRGVSSLANPLPNTMTFCGKPGADFDTAEILYLIPTGCVCSHPHICVDNPRLEYARVASYFFCREDLYGARSKPSHLDNGASITNFFNEGMFSVGAHSQIGEEGFGFERNENGIPIRIPHFGMVRIGEGVEIGANVVIARGTIDDTVIGDHVKIDDHVFVAHNVEIGARSLIIAGAQICGGVKIGADCWIGGQACIREHVIIGDGAVVGLGAVVVKDVAPGTTVMGNPAREKL